MRYSLKSMTIGFEIPLLDTTDSKGNEELANSIASRYLGFFDVLKNDLEVLELPNSNYLFLFTLVVRIDNNTVTRRGLEEEWTKLEDNLSKDLETFLKGRNIIYRQLK